MTKKVQKNREKKARLRKKLRSRSHYPRLSVFRSNKATYAQIIDDRQGKTIAAASTKELKAKTKDKKETKSSQALALGQLLAQKALKQKITQANFDRGAYKYHGRIKAVAAGAREKGLKI